MTARHTRKTVGDFEIHTLANDAVSLSMAPELGGRIVSLRDRVSRPRVARRLGPCQQAPHLASRPIPPTTKPVPGPASTSACPRSCRARSAASHCRITASLWNQAAGIRHRSEGRILLPLESQIPAARVRAPDFPGEKRSPLRLSSREPGGHAHAVSVGMASLVHLEARRSNPLPPRRPASAPAARKCCHGRKPNRATTSRGRIFPKGATPAAKVFLGPLSKGRAEIHAANGCPALAGLAGRAVSLRRHLDHPRLLEGPAPLGHRADQRAGGPLVGYSRAVPGFAACSRSGSELDHEGRYFGVNAFHHPRATRGRK